MMRSEPREEDRNVNIVLQSGIAIGDDKGKKSEDNAWVHKAPVKELEFELERAHEMFMEERRASLMSPPKEARISLIRR